MKTTRSTAPKKKSGGRSSRRSRLAKERGQPVPRRYRVDRKEPNILSELLKAEEDRAPGSQRALSRAGSDDYRSGRCSRHAITIATNMAGRGTDIQLGGNADMRIADEAGDRRVTRLNLTAKAKAIRPRKSEAPRKRSEAPASTSELEPSKGNRPAKTVDKPGGLYVIGTERHESSPHRQPAARPLRSSGRPGRLESSICPCKTT